MDQRQIVDAIGKLTGVVTALEVQTQALLLAMVGSGVHPDLVLGAIRAVPQPVVPAPGREAFERAMEGFWRASRRGRLRGAGPGQEAPRSRTRGVAREPGVSARVPFEHLVGAGAPDDATCQGSRKTTAPQATNTMPAIATRGATTRPARWTRRRSMPTPSDRSPPGTTLSADRSLRRA